MATAKCRLYKYQHKIRILDPSKTIKPPYSYKNNKTISQYFLYFRKNTLHSCLWLRQNEEQRTQQLQQKLINISHLPGNIVCVTRHFISDKNIVSNISTYLYTFLDPFGYTLLQTTTNIAKFLRHTQTFEPINGVTSLISP